MDSAKEDLIYALCGLPIQVPQLQYPFDTLIAKIHGLRQHPKIHDFYKRIIQLRSRSFEEIFVECQNALHKLEKAEEINKCALNNECMQFVLSGIYYDRIKRKKDEFGLSKWFSLFSLETENQEVNELVALCGKFVYFESVVLNYLGVQYVCDECEEVEECEKFRIKVDVSNDCVSTGLNNEEIDMSDNNVKNYKLDVVNYISTVDKLEAHLDCNDQTHSYISVSALNLISSNYSKAFNQKYSGLFKNEIKKIYDFVFLKNVSELKDALYLFEMDKNIESCKYPFKLVIKGTTLYQELCSILNIQYGLKNVDETDKISINLGNFIAEFLSPLLVNELVMIFRFLLKIVDRVNNVKNPAERSLVVRVLSFYQTKLNFYVGGTIEDMLEVMVENIRGAVELFGMHNKKCLAVLDSLENVKNMGTVGFDWVDNINWDEIIETNQ